MKKFISLVLALVMALSLTTVAWGADVVLDGSSVDYMQNTEFQRAIKDLPDGSTVTLKNGNFRVVFLTEYAVPKNLTIIGGENAVIKEFAIEKNVEGLILKNLVFETVLAGANTSGVTIKDLTIENCTCPAIHLGNANGSNIQNVTITNCTITNSPTNFNGITVKNASGTTKVENNTITNAADIGIALLGNVGGTVTVSGNTVNGTGDRALRVAAVQDNATVTFTNNTISNCAVATTAGEGLIKASSVAGTGSVSFSGNTYANVAWNPVTLTAANGTDAVYMPSVAQVGTTTYDTMDAAIAAANGAPVVLLDTSATIPAGYSVVNGKVVAKSSLTGNSTTLDVDDLTITTALGGDVPTTGITGITKYAASTSTTTVNGKTTTKVVPAWFLLSEGAYNYTFVECDKTSADYMFTFKGVGSVYVREMDVPAAFDATPVTLYTAPLKATCEKVGANEDVYVVAKDKYYATDFAVVPGAEQYALLSNGKMVVYYGEATAKAHNWAQATVESWSDKTYATATSVKCPDCKSVIKVYTVPGVFDGKTYLQIPTGVAAGYYYVKGASTLPTGTVVTPSTDKTVTSAETFDAGIAMYVGMSVMAAAGSAVVLKKKD